VRLSIELWSIGGGREGLYEGREEGRKKEMMMATGTSVKYCNVSESNRAFGAATFHHIESQPESTIPLLLVQQKHLKKQMDDTKGIN